MKSRLKKRSRIKLDGLGEPLRQFRLKLDVTWEEFARTLGVDGSTLGKYERNERSLPLDVLEKAADYAGQPPSAVLVWCIRERYPELGRSPSEVAAFLNDALAALEADKL